MDRQRIQVSDEESQFPREESRRRRRRKKAITSSSSNSMDQITVEFVLPTATRGGSGSDTLQLDVAGNWTVEQVGSFAYCPVSPRQLQMFQLSSLRFNHR